MDDKNPLFDLELFKQRLTETIIWCNHQLADHPEQGVKRLWSLVELSQPGHEDEDSIIHMNDDELIQFSNELFELRTQLVTKLPPSSMEY